MSSSRAHTNHFVEQKYDDIMCAFKGLALAEIKQQPGNQIEASVAEVIVRRLLLAYSHPNAEAEAKKIIQHPGGSGQDYLNLDDFMTKMKQNIAFKRQVDVIQP